MKFITLHVTESMKISFKIFILNDGKIMKKFIQFYENFG